MRIASFTRPDGNRSYGTAAGDHILDAGAVMSDKYEDLKSVLAAGAVAELAGVGEAVSLDGITFLPPVPNPEKILCIGLNYLPHILESGRPHPEYPSIFTRYPSSVVGHGVPIERPNASREFDYEGELAFVIGKDGRHIS